MPGKIILLNGASSSGKSSLALALQQQLPLPFWHWSIDHIRSARVLPQARIDSGEFPWSQWREPFFEGFHRSIAALAAPGNNLVVEHIVESQTWMNRLVVMLQDLDVFYVGVHCPLEELERRERERGNRRIGEARADFASVHTFGPYDFECSTTGAVDAVAAGVVAAWRARAASSAFANLLARAKAATALP